MLNLLSIYAGYDSWYEFKKQHLFAGELLQENEDSDEEEINELEKTVSSAPDLPKLKFRLQKLKFSQSKILIYKKQILKTNKLHQIKISIEILRLWLHQPEKFL